jgi:hypothetical protein
MTGDAREARDVANAGGPHEPAEMKNHVTEQPVTGTYMGLSTP